MKIIDDLLYSLDYEASVLLCVSQGATFRQIKGVRLLTMER